MSNKKEKEKTWWDEASEYNEEIAGCSRYIARAENPIVLSFKYGFRSGRNTFLMWCPLCEKKNDIMFASTGKCKWCKFDINKIQSKPNKKLSMQAASILNSSKKLMENMTRLNDIIGT